MATTSPELLEPPDLGCLLSGQHLGEDPLDAHLAGYGFGRLGAVAGQQDRGEAELAKLANRLGARGLDGVADDERGARARRPRRR